MGQIPELMGIELNLYRYSSKGDKTVQSRGMIEKSEVQASLTGH
jgi:hypothetical protein